MFPGVGYGELIFLAIIAVLLFGKNLPQVAKSVGKGYGKLKKSLTDMQKTLDVSEHLEIDEHQSAPSTYDYEEYDEPTAPRFDAPPKD